MSNTFKTFDELSRSIKRSGDKWITSNEKADRNTQYIGVWEMLTSLDFFIKNERKHYESELESMKNTYAPRFLEEKRRVLYDELSQCIKTAVDKVRANVENLAERKQNKLIEMLTSTPSAEQVRLLEVLQMRGDLDAVEMQYILPTFFGNYQAMRVFEAVCGKNGVHLIMPAQLDCRVMFDNIKAVTEYLTGACDEVQKPKNKRDIKYAAFFTVNPEDPNKCLDPVFMDMAAVLDTIPQLNDCKTEKTALSPVEQARVDWYYRDADKSNAQGLIMHTEKIVAQHPEIVPLLKYTPYADHLEIISKARAEGNDN